MSTTEPISGEKGSSNSAHLCSREKYWHEKNDQEKIGTLMDELNRTQRKLKELCEVANDFITHVHHAVDGRLLSEMRLRNRDYPEFNFRTYEIHK